MTVALDDTSTDGDSVLAELSLVPATSTWRSRRQGGLNLGYSLELVAPARLRIDERAWRALDPGSSFAHN